MNVYCRICGAAGAACGDSHQTLPLLTGTAFFKGARTMTDPDPKAQSTEVEQEPVELQEYHYYVGYMETTAMMTPEMAEQVGAVPVGEPLDEADGGKKGNNEANRTSTRMADAEKGGVANPDNEEAATKARTARNKRATGGAS